MTLLTGTLLKFYNTKFYYSTARYFEWTWSIYYPLAHVWRDACIYWTSHHIVSKGVRLSGYTPIGNLYSKVRHILYSIKCRIKGNGPECEYLFRLHTNVCTK